MIQKLREIILSEKNKENFFYMGAFVLLIPAFFFIFDLRKDKFSYASVEGVSLDRRDLSIRFVDYILFFKSLQGVFGDKGASQIRSYLIGNLSDEEFIINNELKNAAFLSLFKNCFGDLSLVDSFVLKKISKSSDLQKEFGLFKEVPIEALKGNKEYLSALQRQGVLIENIDLFVKKLFAGKFAKTMLFLPFSIINLDLFEKEMVANFVIANKYTYTIEEFKKEFDKIDFTDDMLLSFFEQNNFGGKYLSPYELIYDSIIVEKGTLSKDEVEEIFLTGLSREGEENPNKLNYAIEALNEKFKEIKRDLQTIKIDARSNEIVDSIGEVSIETLKLNKNFDYTYICIESNGKVYFLLLNKTEGGKPLDFSVIKDSVREDFIKNEALLKIKNTVEEDRIKCEEGFNLERKSKKFEANLKDSSDKAEKNELKISLAKKNLKKMRENATYLELKEDEIILWHVREIQKEESTSDRKFDSNYSNFPRNVDGLREAYKQRAISTKEFEPIIENLKKSPTIDNSFGLSL